MKHIFKCDVSFYASNRKSSILPTIECLIDFSFVFVIYVFSNESFLSVLSFWKIIK